MEKEKIISAFQTAIRMNLDLRKSLFGEEDIPEKMDDVVLSISSLDMADLLISVEELLGVEFAEECMITSKTSIGELAERIEKSV